MVLFIKNGNISPPTINLKSAQFPSYIKKLKAIGLSPVSKKEGQRMADKINACCYIECSVSKFINVNEVFHNAIKYALKAGESKDKDCEIF